MPAARIVPVPAKTKAAVKAYTAPIIVYFLFSLILFYLASPSSSAPLNFSLSRVGGSE